jgi:hypothetical protein
MKKSGKRTAKKTGKKPQRRRVVTPPQNHLGEWGRQMVRKQKSWAIVALTHMLVRTAGGIYEFEQQVVRGNLSWLEASRPAEEWEQFYRQPCKVLQLVADHSCPSVIPPEEGDSGASSEDQIGLGTLLRSLGIQARALRRSGDEELRRELRKELATPAGRGAALSAWKLVQELRQADLDELFGLDEEMDDHTFNTGIRRPAIQFFMLVWIPCLIAHGTSTADLFRDAEQGDFEALVKLLEIDKRLSWCPTMARRIDEACLNREDGRFAMLMNALSGSPRAFTLGRYKCAISAYILRMSRSVADMHPLFGRRMTPLEVRGAFDAAARDRGLLVDEDLPASRDAYRKAILRERAFASSTAWDTFVA